MSSAGRITQRFERATASQQATGSTTRARPYPDTTEPQFATRSFNHTRPFPLPCHSNAARTYKAAPGENQWHDMLCAFCARAAMLIWSLACNLDKAP